MNHTHHDEAASSSAPAAQADWWERVGNNTICSNTPKMSMSNVTLEDCEAHSLHANPNHLFIYFTNVTIGGVDVDVNTDSLGMGMDNMDMGTKRGDCIFWNTCSSLSSEGEETNAGTLYKKKGTTVEVCFLFLFVFLFVFVLLLIGFFLHSTCLNPIHSTALYCLP